MKFKNIVYTCVTVVILLVVALTPVFADELKSPADILRLARQLEASSPGDAEDYYKALIEAYPKSREAATAKQRIAAMKKAKEQKNIAEERKRKQREEQERAEANRREQQRRDSDCDHVYIGKVFSGKSAWGVPLRLKVEGFSAKTRRVTVYNMTSGQYDDLSCYDVPQ